MSPVDAVRREPLHERVLEGQVEARRAGVALAAGAAAQLVVDAARVVALGADDVQAARRHDLVVLDAASSCAFASAVVVDLRRRLGGVDALLVERAAEARPVGVAAQLDVRAAAGHVGRDGHGAAAPRLGHDRRFLLVELGVEDLVPDAAPLEHRPRAPRSSRR